MNFQRGKKAIGRPKSDVYSKLGYELKKCSASNKYSVLCKQCNKILQNVAESRLKQHRNVCKLSESIVTSDPEESEVISLLENTSIEENQLNTASCTNLSTNEPLNITSSTHLKLGDIVEMPSNSSPLFLPLNSNNSNIVQKKDNKCVAKKRKMQNERSSNRITSYMDAVSEKEIKDITEALAEFFYGCNISFNKVESTLFKNLIGKLRPAYVAHVPSRRQLSSSLLDEAYSRSIENSSSSLLKESVMLRECKTGFGETGFRFHRRLFLKP